jgi:hypothetical protein
MGIDPNKVRFFIAEDHGPSALPDGRVFKRAQYTVYFMHKDRKGLRAKAATISLPFTTRYGVGVFATFDGHGHWAVSADATDKDLQASLEQLFATGELPLPILSPDEITKDMSF